MKLFYGVGGSLLSDEEIEGVTQELLSGGGSSREYYGHRFFICESMTEKAAQKFAELLGGELTHD